VKRLPGLILLILIAINGSAQSYQFIDFGLSEGFCDNFAYTINQDQKGFLWIGTGQGLCRFDGIEFKQDFEGDSIPLSIASTSFLDSRGRLWFGHDNGYISILVDDRFRLMDPGGQSRSAVKTIREDRKGNILVLSQQSGITIFNPELQITYSGNPDDSSDPFAGKFHSTFQITADENLLVGSDMGLSIYRFDENLNTYIETGIIPDLEYLPVTEIVPAVLPDQYWVGTDDEGLFRVTGKGYNPQDFSVQKIGIDQGLEYARITSIVFDGERRVWITDFGKGLYRLEVDESGNPGTYVLFDKAKGMPNNSINEVFIDEEGNQWFSTQGSGIAVLRDQAFTFFGLWEEEQLQDISAVYIDGEDRWFGGVGRIALISNDQLESAIFLDTDNGLPEDRVTALYVDQGGDLYIGTERSGLYLKRRGSSQIEALVVARNSLENIVNAIDGNSDSLFVATNNGVYSYHPETGRRVSRTTANGLPHNKINDILVDHQGIAWIATETRGLWSVNSDKQFLITKKLPVEFKTLVEGEDGIIWAGTDGNGVFKFNFNDETLDWFSIDAGLKSEYTYALGIDPNGYIWVGHREGLSRIDPMAESIRTFGKKSGFSSDILDNAMATSESGKMYMGSTEGLIFYDAYQAKEDTVAPKLSFKSVEISEQSYDPSKDIKLKYDKYRLRIDFVGINLSNPEQVTYQYKLEGFQDEWTEYTNLDWAFFPIADGDFTFKVRACDGNGNCSVDPLSLNISVKIPIWKAWWFIVSSILLVLAIIFVIFKIRERNQKAIQEYLQRQLDERTREVVMQKEEIEIKNRDITDSINYAQRIQASILPPIKKLHDAFSGSFVFYQPRDIVSGDFYWYEKIDENKFMVVCADSTGHGVPGAFMSMIGTTLIKDICLRTGIQKPSQVLTTLDNEVREALNQNVETNGSNDGMDIIVAEVDMSNYKFTVSSAMRPVIIYSGGEQIYVKGSRSSIGGQLDEDKLEEKEFIDQEYMLNKGDIIYMFSDGYPDQFGGPLGRKFKMVRLKNLLRDIHDKPMDEQYNYIKSNFFLWKEDLEQVDDVLFMGIKL